MLFKQFMHLLWSYINSCVFPVADVNEKLKVIREDVLKLTEVLIDLQQKQISEVTNATLYV